VSKTYWNRGVRSHRRGTKRIWQLYYLDDDDGKLHTRRVNVLEALYWKTQVRRKRTVFCVACGYVAVGFYKNDKEILGSECPDCDDGETKLLPIEAIEALENVLEELQT
jgi:hypothetical protein